MALTREIELCDADTRPAVIGDLLGSKIRSNVDFFVAEITPRIAAELLLLNRGNRPIAQRIVDRYARNIKTGNWMLTGQTVIIDSNNDLRNGQHTLKACVQAGESFTTAVAYGVSPGAFRDMDTGRKRSGSDVLAINGEVNSNNLAAIVRHLLNHDRGDIGVSRVDWSVHEIEDYLSKRPELRAVNKKHPLGTKFRVPQAPICAAWEILRRIDEHRADQFISLLKNGDSDVESPISVLRDRLLSDISRKRRKSTREIFLLMFKTWNYWIRGRRVTTMQSREDEVIQCPIDPADYGYQRREIVPPAAGRGFHD